MKEKLALAVIVAALSGTAVAAGTQSQTGTEQQPSAQTGTEQQPSAQMGAEQQPGAESSSLQALDTNMDGTVSKDEAQSNPELVNRWDELDANGDGQLDEEEFAGFEPEGTGATGESEEKVTQ